MKTVGLLLPNQLFPGNFPFDKKTQAWLVEESLYFNQYAFHKQKLVFHRASMKSYQEEWKRKKVLVNYTESHEPQADIRKWVAYMAEQGYALLEYIDPVDDWLERRLLESAGRHGLSVRKHPNPQFLLRKEDVEAYTPGRRNYFQTDFYIAQRKLRNILLDEKGKPRGGQWSYDAENREKFPKGKPVPAPAIPGKNKIVDEAMEQVEKQFPQNPGLVRPFHYPVTREESLAWLDDFLQHRFGDFGRYEDAMVARENLLFHSKLSPLINAGLLLPGEVIEKALAVADRFAIPLNSQEGFIRQILGWREFIRLVYEKEGRFQRTRNYWNHTRKIPPSFWTGETGIGPIDIVIKKILKTGYCHHIERLMVLGNFMLLCEFDPDDIYRWFMEMFIDSYDWVMVPNIYGMTQFADGGLMTTKPYISGSNYLIKMGDWEKGPWQEIWDGLFWRFMHLHRDFFLQNPRLGMLIKTFDKMPAEKRERHLRKAEGYLYGGC